MKTTEEILRALDCCTRKRKSCHDCPVRLAENDCRKIVMKEADYLIRALLSSDYQKNDTCKNPEEEPRPMKYWDNISAINERQEAKGQAKYGEQLEDNVTLTTIQRIEHAQEEAIDLLKYLEHLKQIANDGITANDYQRAAMRTANDLMSRDEMLTNGVLGLCGETGEVADIVKKATFQGHELDKEHIAEELGDVAWYLALTAHAIGYKLGYIFQKNVDKLMKRYPDGFDKSRSINREDESNHESK